jgi:glyoxylase-like metal-dependent hydrolase (beta-lactamase superfamily II)
MKSTLPASDGGATAVDVVVGLVVAVVEVDDELVVVAAVVDVVDREVMLVVVVAAASAPSSPRWPAASVTPLATNRAPMAPASTRRLFMAQSLPLLTHLTDRSSRSDRVAGVTVTHEGTEHAAPRPRKQEQEAATTDVTEVAPGILRTQLPISMPGLGHVNCYLLEDERGIAVVDPGLPGPQSWKALVDRLGRAGYKVKDVHTVVVTHSHPDHFGGAGTLRHEAGAEIVTHKTFRTWMDLNEGEVVTDDDGDAIKPPHPWDTKLPWKDETFKPPMKRRMRMRVMRVVAKRYIRNPAPSRRLEEAEVITLGRREWVSLHTPGHTPDHLCLFDPAGGVVLSGDHVLPTITPHISGLVAGTDPLTEFFASLDKMKALEGVTLALPAHGHPFTDLAGRADAIHEHHQERLERLREGARDLGPTTVTELMKVLFKQRSWGQMAESETFAHLEHMRLNGEARVVDETSAELVYELIDT